MTKTLTKKSHSNYEQVRYLCFLGLLCVITLLILSFLFYSFGWNKLDLFVLNSLSEFVNNIRQKMILNC